jgi:quinol monooxygenase YgiN
MDASLEPITMLYVVQAKSGKERQVENLLRGLVTTSRYEPGNIIYESFEVTNRSGLFMVYSVWLSQEALDAHHSNSAVRKAIEQFESLADGDFADGAHVLRKLRPSG